MEAFSLNTILTLHLFFLTSSNIKGQMMQSTNFSTPQCLVLQICPEELAGETELDGKKYRRIASYVFLPNSKPGTTISCPLNYFQESCSIPLKWIKDDSGKKLQLNSIDKLNKVILTKKINTIEVKIDILDYVSFKLFDYFNFDVENNLDKFRGFDCYALQSLFGNVKFYPPNPSWDYKKTNPKLGNFVVLTTSEKLPDSIKHWAICLGEDFYLSKFGRSGEGAQSQVTIMNLEGMKLLYDCKLSYTAFPKDKAEPWSGFDK